MSEASARDDELALFREFAATASPATLETDR